MFNSAALARSLDSLIEMGNDRVPMGKIREYVMLYNSTMEYMYINFNECSILKEYQNKFPKIEFKEFNSLLDKMLIGIIVLFVLILRGLALRGSSIGGIGDLEEYNPRAKKYHNEIIDQIPVINMIASELIQRLGQ